MQCKFVTKVLTEIVLVFFKYKISSKVQQFFFTVVA